MIEEVVTLETEFSFHPFGDRKVLHDSRIGEEHARTAIAVKSDVAKIADSRVSEWARRCDDVGNRREELAIWIATRWVLKRSRTQGERP